MEKSFFGSLFDTSFTTFITRAVAKVFYIITMVILVLFAGVGFVTGLVYTSEDALIGFLVMIASPIAALVLLVLLRLLFESAVALVLIAENTRPASPATSSASAKKPKD